MKFLRKTTPLLFKNKPAFTLVELLVVISIIAVLATMGIAAFRNVQKNARDARRKADIDSIAQAMESNYGVNVSYQYATLLNSMFSSGGVPIDPTNTNTTPDGVCPGVCKYCVFEGVTQQTGGACLQANNKVAADGSEPLGGINFPYWAVCANLEDGSYFCRSSSR